MEFEKGENVLKEVKKFCYQGVTISCYGGASEAVSGRTGSDCKEVQEVKWCVSGEAAFIFEAMGEDLPL